MVFPRALQEMGIPLSDLKRSDTPFFGIVLGVGEYPLGHIYLPVAFGTAENFHIETLRVEVPTFNCVYNAIVGRPMRAKFMAVPHYPYLILKMPAPGGTLSIRADFKGASECVQEAMQMALEQNHIAAQKKLKVDETGMSQEDLQILTQEAASSMAI